MRAFLPTLLFVIGVLCGRVQADDKVLFEFFSSCEEEVSLAYKENLRDPWRFVKMHKDGHRFTVRHAVENEIWYEFVTAANVWYRRDPLNRHLNAGRPYLKRGPVPLATNRNLPVRHVPSAHFDYFTTGDGEKIARLEAVYAKLTADLLAMFEPNLAPAHGRKIRYYGGMFEGMYAWADNAEIVDRNDEANSHEIIHVLLHAYARYAPFAEGVAQCFQERGNRRPLVEPNCSLAAKDKYKRLKLWDVLRDFQRNNDYHLAGSFVYHQLFVAPDLRAPFVAFLKDIGREGRTFEEVQRLYQHRTGKPLSTAVREWERWVANVTPASAVYVDWND